jgi:serine/threonine-protein kinase RsbW
MAYTAADSGTSTARTLAAASSPEIHSGGGLAHNPAVPRSTALDLGPLAGAVPCARGHARNVLWEWGITGDLTDNVELIVSELVTNAIDATGLLRTPAPQPVQLRLAEAHRFILIEVADASPDPPRLNQPAPGAEHGRGLMLVHALSMEWGSYPLEPCGKVIWAKVTR